MVALLLVPFLVGVALGTDPVECTDKNIAAVNKDGSPKYPECQGRTCTQPEEDKVSTDIMNAPSCDAIEQLDIPDCNDNDAGTTMAKLLAEVVTQCKAASSMDAFRASLNADSGGAGAGSGSGDSSDDPPCTKADLQKYVDAMADYTTCESFISDAQDKKLSLPDCEVAAISDDTLDSCKTADQLTALKAAVQALIDAPEPCTSSQENVVGIYLASALSCDELKQLDIPDCIDDGQSMQKTQMDLVKICESQGFAEMQKMIMDEAEKENMSCEDKMIWNILMAKTCDEVKEAYPSDDDDCKSDASAKAASAAEAKMNLQMEAQDCTNKGFDVWRPAALQKALDDAGAGSGAGSGSDSSDDPPCTKADLQKYVDTFSKTKTCDEMQAAFKKGFEDKSLPQCDPNIKGDPTNCNSTDDLEAMKSDLQKALDTINVDTNTDKSAASGPLMWCSAVLPAMALLWLQ